MTKSFPWQGIVGGAGAGDDSGRYTAGEWWSAWGIQQRASGLIVPTVGASLRTVSIWTNIGVYYGVEDRLEVTDGGGFVADVATGAALVEGTLFYENTARALTMPASQTYYVVVRKNYSAVDYTPPGYAAGDGVVPAYTCRITWVAAIVQDTTRVTYWDIPLATVVTDGSEITTVTDTREWVDAELKYSFAQYAYGWNSTGAAAVIPLDSIAVRGLPMIDAANTTLWARLMAPEDKVPNTTCIVQPVIIASSTASGDVVMSHRAFFSLCGESYATGDLSNGGTITMAVGTNKYCPTELEIDLDSMGAVDPGETIISALTRTGTDGNDDLAGTIYGFGCMMTYLGWR